MYTLLETLTVGAPLKQDSLTKCDRKTGILFPINRLVCIRPRKRKSKKRLDTTGGKMTTQSKKLSFPHQKRNIASMQRTNFKARPSICYQAPPFLGKALDLRPTLLVLKAPATEPKPYMGDCNQPRYSYNLK